MTQKANIDEHLHLSEPHRENLPDSIFLLVLVLQKGVPLRPLLKGFATVITDRRRRWLGTISGLAFDWLVGEWLASFPFVSFKIFVNP